MLRNPIETDLKIVPHIVSCCCILHNICEERKEIIDEFDIISDQELINNVTTSEVDIINGTERDLVADYIFSRRNKCLIYQDNSLEIESQGKLL